MSTQLFAAQLRYWRKRRGQSQLDLSLEAGVSARHVSFLESGRASPSAEMVVRLLSVLQAPLRAQNDALRALGFEARYPEPKPDALPVEAVAAIEQMMAQQDPYPLTVLGGDFRILRSNCGAAALFEAFVAEPERLPAEPDIISLFFDPHLLRPFVEAWEPFACGMLNRVHRELLHRGGDVRLQALLDRVLALPGVPSSWRHPDLSTDAAAVQSLRLTRDATSVGFLVTITKFAAPQQVALQELSVESGFPLDDATRATCQRLVSIRRQKQAALAGGQAIDISRRPRSTKLGARRT